MTNKYIPDKHMPDKFEDIILHVPEKRLDMLRKDIEKYKENVNKCNISMIDSLSYNIGSEMDLLKFVIKLTDEQRKNLKGLEKEYKTTSDKIKQCQCIKKIEKVK